jgi:CheY-like chemotaxis protein
MAIRMRVLLLEDHTALREMIGDHLTQRGFAVDGFGRGDEASAAAAVAAYDAIILDLGLPDVDGMEVLATIRAVRAEGALPAVIVTARDAIDDRARCCVGRGSEPKSSTAVAASPSIRPPAWRPCRRGCSISRGGNRRCSRSCCAPEAGW